MTPLHHDLPGKAGQKIRGKLLQVQLRTILQKRRHGSLSILRNPMIPNKASISISVKLPNSTMVPNLLFTSKENIKLIVSLFCLGRSPIRTLD